MMISLSTAWIATICAGLTAVKFFVKKNKRLNRIFHDIHIPLGVVLIVAGLVHGLAAGNPLGTSFTQASFGQLLFTWNMGTLCFVLSILLGLTYVLRKILKKNWMKLHRILTVVFVVTIVIHVYQVGIALPRAIFLSEKEAETSENISNEENINPTETEDVTKEEKTDDSNNIVVFSGATLKDGTYEGAAEGYNGDIKVSVVVQNGAVTDISIVEEKETPQYLQRAKEIIQTIVNGQSLEVDGITGATYSSKGIQNAVYNALQEAVISGELKITDIQISNSRGHGKPQK